MESGRCSIIIEHTHTDTHTDTDTQTQRHRHTHRHTHTDTHTQTHTHTYTHTHTHTHTHTRPVNRTDGVITGMYAQRQAYTCTQGAENKYRKTDACVSIYLSIHFSSATLTANIALTGQPCLAVGSVRGGTASAHLEFC